MLNATVVFCMDHWLVASELGCIVHIGHTPPNYHVVDFIFTVKCPIVLVTCIVPASVVILYSIRKISLNANLYSIIA